MKPATCPSLSRALSCSRESISMIVDPWGEVLARARDEETFIAADLDFARQDEIRDQLPSLANRMPATYTWPQEVKA